MSTSSSSSSPAKTQAYLAFGSNVGDSIRTIEEALNALQAHPRIELVRTSGLYKTKAMYVEDQADFVNGACEIETDLSPLDLLDVCQGIETGLGRKKTIEKGPRNIDLDILLYGNEVISEPRLLVPHKLMLERAFVLQPLCELIPDEKAPPLSAGLTYEGHLARLPSLETPISTTTLLRTSMAPLQAMLPNRRTAVMAVLNITPDSFSDGGVLTADDSSRLQEVATQHIKAGATILDIGGQSTRPGAQMVSAEEEISRVVPAVRAVLKAAQDLGVESQIAISVDTFRASVARAAIVAGAHVVNDVSAGQLDREMFSTVAELGCPIVLMHMRGDPSNMSSRENTTYRDGLIPTIAQELHERVNEAETAGIRRWRIILDPGIGFAKTVAGNLELLRRLAELRRQPGLRGLPWLVGTSRKGFIGRITGVEQASERTWGTAAAVAAAVQGGAEIVRVHDTNEMVKVVKMADAIWRR